PGDSINAFSAKGRSSVQNERFDFLSKLLNWRKGKSVIHTGLLTQYVPENDVYVYFRYNETEKIMVILNNNETDQTIKTDRYTENLENITNGTDVMTGKTFDLKSSFTIQKQTALILELH
ncbi:MAG: cyclomaltodextrinase C-terminal domain-containing protein, partial [Paludibacter sp.]